MGISSILISSNQRIYLASGFIAFSSPLNNM
jgi:hypothetical protein